MHVKTDSELIGEFQNGEIKAYNELVRRYQQKVYWIARRIVGTHEDADDVVQDTFLKIFNALKKFRSESGFYTWLYRITINTSLNALRKKKVREFLRLGEYAGEVPQSGPDAGEILVQQEYRTVVERAIQKLPPKQKMVFIMRYYDEMPFGEIAGILGKSVGGLKATYFFALKKIKEYIRDEIKR